MSTHIPASSALNEVVTTDAKPYSTSRKQNPSRRASGLSRSANPLFSLVALGVLALVFALAFLNGAQPTLADKLTLLALALTSAALFWTPLFRLFGDDAQADTVQADEVHLAGTRGDEAAAFALTLAMFVVYGMARAAGPDADKSWSLHFALLPTTTFAVSWAARIVVAGAALTAPLWLKRMNAWTRAVLWALGIVVALGIASFCFLRGYYTVGESDAVLDPKPLVDTLLQAVEYGALALVCCAACAQLKTRRIVLRVLPLLLGALWARHQWFPAPPPPEDAE